ncbi:hypothetical protein WJX77_010637 [Trebouxia sp. C0004]
MARSMSTTLVTKHRRADRSKKQEKSKPGSRLGKLDESMMKRVHSAPGLADQDVEASLPKIKIGICAMDKKAKSKPMKAILQRLLAFGEFETELFGDDNILNNPVSQWPNCDCLLSWHSEGFPLKKAQQYAALRKPYLINDMLMQDILLDRRKVYQQLQKSGIPVPLHIIVDRDSLSGDQKDPEGFVETEDYVELNGVQVKKPFVEKPVNGEDHNIHIYYPHSMGGGVKKLYRKVENRSGDYDPNHPGSIRRDGSYIIEEFLTTGGTDVKVYTVGPRYAHAEARKSPVVDGKVTRSADGKELRFPVLLSPQEKEIARMVCLAFGQKVCGFDLLRSERGKSYVCDVNGWSFVKNSDKYYDDVAVCLRGIILAALAPAYAARNSRQYYDDTAGILRNVILSAIAPHRMSASPMPQGGFTRQDNAAGPTVLPMSSPLDEPMFSAFDDDVADSAEEGHEELRCVLAVVRHGDRTPKQKMKMKITQAPMLDLLHRHIDGKGKQAKLKSPNELQELLDATHHILGELEKEHKAHKAPQGVDALKPDADADELREKFRIVRTVLEQGGSFAGINRKVQIKPLKWSQPEEGSKEEPRVTEALLILKHGGVLTHAGRQQAEDLGKLFRMVMYPRYGPAGNGFLRLHSTYRHDLKIYTSDEGRVQTSAAAFTQGLLDLEGTSLTPILVSLVKKDAGMLDAFGKGASEDIQLAKSELYSQMTWDRDSKSSAFAEPQVTTTLPSPPPSPKPRKASLEETSVESPLASPRSAKSLDLTHQSASSPSAQSALKSPQGRGITSRPSFSDAKSPPARVASRSILESSSRSNIHEALANYRSGAEMSAPTSRRQTGDGDRPKIHPMPHNPLSLLTKLTAFIKVLVEQLRQQCLEEKVDKHAEAVKAYSALTQSPKEWTQEGGVPCGGERLLLMFDRWRKLLKAFYNEKKKQYDISKIPDIYDSAKYDAIHNSHLPLDLQPVYQTAKVLAEAVIPNEYGIDPAQKLRIGSKICNALLGKLLADLANMRDESLATAGEETPTDEASPYGNPDEGDLGSVSMQDSSRTSEAASQSGVQGEALGASGSLHSQKSGLIGTEDSPEDGEDPESEVDKETIHRLCPTYATDINSPLRHVRTRIYFTSESHVHSLINVLRFSHLAGVDNGGPVSAMVSEEAQQLLHDATELDYLTHIIIRMYENKRVPVDSPQRFRVELLFSPGASFNPYEVVPLHKDHTLPVQPRACLHKGKEVYLSQLEQLCVPHSTPTKASTYTYSMF